MQMSQKLSLLNDKFKVDAVFEVKQESAGRYKVTDVFFDYVEDYRAGFEIIRRSDDIDQKLYNLIEAAAFDAFDMNEAKEL